jgi:hypothetical protein
LYEGKFAKLTRKIRSSTADVEEAIIPGLKK